jgi:hypothetical protein
VEKARRLDHHAGDAEHEREARQRGLDRPEQAADEHVRHDGGDEVEEVNRHPPPPQGLVGRDRARCRGGVARHEQRSPHNNLGE